VRLNTSAVIADAVRSRRMALIRPNLPTPLMSNNINSKWCFGHKCFFSAQMPSSLGDGLSLSRQPVTVGNFSCVWQCLLRHGARCWRDCCKRWTNNMIYEAWCGPPVSFIIDDLESPLRAVCAAKYVVWYCDLWYARVGILRTAVDAF